MTDWSAIRQAREQRRARYHPTPLKATDRRIPPEAIRCRATAIALSVLDGATTYNEVMADTGIDRGQVHHHLQALLDAGVVAMEYRRQGTLRPLVRLVAFG